VTRRALIAGALAAVFVVPAAGALPAARDTAASGSAYYVARADPRLCPSPMCGGIWVDRVNASSTVCGNGARQGECYAASADLTRLPVDEKGRVQLQAVITEGRAVARGTLVRGLVEGSPQLDTFVVSEVWTASSGMGRALGVFHRLRDNGIRCVTTPCFSIRASVLNTPRFENVSRVVLSPTGAPLAERRRALEQLSGPGLIGAGRVVRARSGGRNFVATQFYLRAPG
jgi:hypothetical protein